MRNKTIVLLLGSASLALTAAACKQAGDEAATEAVAGSASGINLAAMDKSVKPGDDFFAYANGSWIKKTEIPADRSSIGAFFITQQELEKRMDGADGRHRQVRRRGRVQRAQVADYRAAFMDQAGIDQRTPAGAQGRHRPLHGDRRQAGAGAGDRIDDPRRRRSAERDRPPDRKSVRRFRHPVDDRPVEERPLSAAGRHRPARPRLLSLVRPEMAKIRDAYRPFIAKMLASAGLDNAEARAKRVYDLESKIAAAHATIVETEDSFKANNPWSQADFAKKAPGIDWGAFFQGAQLSTVPTIVVWHPEPTRKLSALVASEPLDAWKDWLAFHQIIQSGPVLPSQMHKDDFAFFGTTLNGTPQERPRDKQLQNSINGLLGDAVGQVYVAKYFPASEKAAIEQMVDRHQGRPSTSESPRCRGWRRKPRRKHGPKSRR